MPVIRDFGNRFQQTLEMPVKRNGEKDISKKSGIDTDNRQCQARKAINERDSVQSSPAAYESICTSDKMSAASGKDILGITKGDKDNSFVIHFSDSAMVSRAVSRGYITVNGVKLELSEETKQ